VAFPDEQPPARTQERAHHAGPTPHIGQPTQRSDAGVDEIEAFAAEHLDGAVQVGLDELDRLPTVERQLPGDGERRGREVEPRHPCAEARQRDGVRADVALEVDGIEPGDVAEARKVEPHDV
jgi:hypothetical protein